MQLKANAQIQGAFDDIEISEGKPEHTNLVIHKIKAETFYNKEEFKIPFEHNAGKISIEQLKNYGNAIDRLNGVTFKYWKIDNDILKEFENNIEKYSKEENIINYISLLPAERGISNLATTTQKTQTIDTEKGIVKLSLDEGTYWFIEDSYVKDENDPSSPDNVSSSFAIPFGIELPITNVTDIIKNLKTYLAGSVYLNDVHIYQKNTASKNPSIKKYVNEDID